MFIFFSWVQNVNLFCGEDVGVVTDSLEEGVSRGEFAISFDWQELLVFGTSEILATFAETNKGAEF